MLHPLRDSLCRASAVSKTVDEVLRVARCAVVLTGLPSCLKLLFYRSAPCRRTGRSPPESRSKGPGSVVPVPCCCKTDLRSRSSLCGHSEHKNWPAIKKKAAKFVIVIREKSKKYLDSTKSSKETEFPLRDPEQRPNRLVDLRTPQNAKKYTVNLQ